MPLILLFVLFKEDQVNMIHLKTPKKSYEIWNFIFWEVIKIIFVNYFANKAYKAMCTWKKSKFVPTDNYTILKCTFE